MEALELTGIERMIVYYFFLSLFIYNCTLGALIKRVKNKQNNPARPNLTSRNNNVEQAKYHYALDFVIF